MFESKSFLATLTAYPGVYCMRDKAGDPLYVGKAKNLKKRLASYFRQNVDPKIAQMVAKIATIDVTVTASEKEALLLENALIKSLDPHYNVIFRDDKSYPFLFISKHPFPRLTYLRGKQSLPGDYFGPFPSAIAVKQTLLLLEKIFKIRSCDDTFFNNRSRPCLQYQINRCTAPCVGYIDETRYHEDVDHVRQFLKGKTTKLIDGLIDQMEAASKSQDFEKAGEYRDQIAALRMVTEQQGVYRHRGDIDVIALAIINNQCCLQLLYIREGKILDSRSFFPKRLGEGDPSQIVRSFISQFYCDPDHAPSYPGEILINISLEDEVQALQDLISNLAGKTVKIALPQRGQRAQWMTLAHASAQESLKRRIQHKGVVMQRGEALKKVLGFTQPISRIECFDISHTQGEATIASCVVFGHDGPMKSEYRRYNLDVPESDDYAAMSQALIKRYLKRKERELPLPDILIVDGGKGQLSVATKALLECQLDDIVILGIAKGAGRKPGLETLYVRRLPEDTILTVKLKPTDQALHLLQQIRDEAHRFAITGHRQKRAKTRRVSPLEGIPGIGPKRRQQLLNHFAGMQGLSGASVEAIARVPGISRALAEAIYKALH